MNQVESLVSEFDKLLRGQGLKVATEVFERMKTLEKGFNISLENMEEFVIEENELQEENNMLKNGLKGLDKYD